MNWASVRWRSGLSKIVSSGLSCMMFPSLGRTDFDASAAFFSRGPDHRDNQHAMFQHGLLHLDAVCEQEVPVKLPGSDPAVEILPARIVLLLAANEQLIVFLRDLEFAVGKSCHR